MKSFSFECNKAGPPPCDELQSPIDKQEPWVFAARVIKSTLVPLYVLSSVSFAFSITCLAITFYTDENALYGTIPSEIGKLANVEFFDIDTNALTGTVPSEFGDLIHMVELDLDKNKLTGTIPSEVSCQQLILNCLVLRDAPLCTRSNIPCPLFSVWKNDKYSGD